MREYLDLNAKHLPVHQADIDRFHEILDQVQVDPTAE
jgi:hypothetical protein